MSRDLLVFAPRVASASEVGHLADRLGCVLEPDADAWWFLVSASGPPQHRFLVMEPQANRSVDLPVVGAHALHELGCELAAPPCYALQLPLPFADAWPAMVDAGCALADLLGGVVLDPSDERVVWPAQFADLQVPVAAEVRVDTIDLSWHGSPAAERPGWARRVLEIAQTTFPEAVPVTWEPGHIGKSKPRPFRWSDIEEFEQASTTDIVVWQASPPFFDGRLSRVTNADGGNRARYPSPFSHVALSLNAAALEDDPNCHRQLLDLVTAVADEIDAVYAHGQLARNMLYRDGEIFSGQGSAPCGYNFAVPTHGCIGLPPRGVWLEWFGKPYLPYVTDALAPISRAAGSGLLAEYGRDERLRASLLPEGLIQGSGKRPAAVIPRT